MGGASLGRVFVMASLRFGQSKEPSQLMAPEEKRDGSFDVIFFEVMAAWVVHHWDGSL